MQTLFPTQLSLTASERAELEGFVRRSSTPQAQARRARVVLAMNEGGTNPDVAARCGVHVEVPRLLRQRWLEAQAGWAGCLDEPKILRARIGEVLRGRVSTGHPPTVTPEQVAALLALACEKPEETGQPFTHWTASLLAEEAVRRGPVESISRSRVSRFLKGRRA